MKKKIMIIISIILITILAVILYQYIRVKTAKVNVVLIDNLNLEVNDKKHVSSFIKSINGKIVNDYIIDSSKLGSKKISFTYINDQKIKVHYFYNIKVVDDISPIIWLNNSYKVSVGSNTDLNKSILCGDNYDDRPTCKIEGKYDLNTIGNYNLIYKAKDKSGNKTIKKFTLIVEPKTDTIDDTDYIDFNDIKTAYKNSKTMVGLDISKHQGDVDFSKLKAAGVDFVIIRVGYGYNNKNYLDEKFKENIKKANEVGLKTGVYFYSYADSIKEAKNEAKWVLKQIKPYKVNLNIGYDWESWSNFTEYHLSFYNLTNVAENFLQVIENKGYKGMLYSSKNYLESIWFQTDYDIWLAQYNTKVTYEGKYKYWQLCENGKVDGINTNVDIDIMNK